MLLLAGVIVIVYPNTDFQLWLGVMLSTFCLIIVYKLEPYRFQHSQHVQTAALMQLLCRAEPRAQRTDPPCHPCKRCSVHR